MISRLITFLIVAFFLVMTGLLVQTVYFPSESRFAQADPEFVIGLFLRNSTLSELTIYKDNSKVGEITLKPQQHKQRIDAAETYSLILDTTGEVELPSLPRQTLRSHVEFHFDETWGLDLLELAIRFAEPEVIKIELNVNPKTAEFDYKVFKRGEEIPFDADQQAVGKSQMQMLLMAWGVDPTVLDDTEAAAREQERLSSMSARHGTIDIAGKRIHAYVLTIQILTGSELKLYFTDDGKLVKVTTGLGYEALAEEVDPRLLLPPDAS
jgi:hypothetical protein